MFCDEVTVHLSAGKGGNGCIAFRREKFVPRGGPNGGEGGKGGSIILKADENINTLAEFLTHKHFRAKDGENGKGSDMGGSDAEDLILPVPVGTTVFDEKKRKQFADLKHHGDMLVIARGGKGGFGNAHFKSSTRQAPRFAELGEPGGDIKVTLELKLVADVGFIGLPSVGKSTLLSRVSNARPKIAAYHFTTIVPNLGLVTLKEFGGSIQQSFLACDLPGLIEDAHKGKGLGIKFLKHVARNRILVHLIDVNSLDPAKDYKIIRNELKKFSRTLTTKPEIVVFNKIDSIDEETLKEVTKAFQKKNRSAKKILAISCVKGTGLRELMFEIWKRLEEEKAKEYDKKPKDETSAEAEIKIYRPHLEGDPRSFEVKTLRDGKKKSTFEVHGHRIEQIVVMTDFSNPEAVARVYDVLARTGVDRELKRHGAKFGDTVMIRGQRILFRD